MISPLVSVTLTTYLRSLRVSPWGRSVLLQDSTDAGVQIFPWERSPREGIKVTGA